MIAANLETVQSQMRAACQRAGRDLETVRLIAVSKTMPLDQIQSAHACGLQHFGENRVEEAREKMIQFPQVHWHMIGHIQSRKAREVMELGFSLIHSVDSSKLAARLNNFAHQPQPILLEMNVSGETSKSGFQAANWAQDQVLRATLWAEIKAISQLAHLEIQGLMTMAPYEADPQTTRPVFQALVALREALQNDFPALSWRELSMGMTNDFEVAIEEGATLIRVGRAIFGERT